MDPSRFGEVPIVELLRAAARGTVGVDKRLIRSIIERGEAAASDVLAFSREPEDTHRVGMDFVLTDLFRHFQSPEALDFYLDVIRRGPEEVGDDLIQALLPFGEKAVEP